MQPPPYGQPRLFTKMRAPGGVFRLFIDAVGTLAFKPASAFALSLKMTGPSPAKTFDVWTFSWSASRLTATYLTDGTEFRSAGRHHFAGALTVDTFVYDLKSFDLFVEDNS